MASWRSNALQDGQTMDQKKEMAAIAGDWLADRQPEDDDCKGGHLACTDCRGERPGNQWKCQKYERGGGFDVRNTAMKTVLSSVRRIQYCKVLQLQVPVSEPQLFLFAEEDGRAFFVVGGMLDIIAPIIVSVVYIRAGASTPPHYTAKL
ncbi:uncharacterized protein [Aegilops tauschii subsp. strangulata]|uniref:uncharacterized protein n=1 Tax=Aegilops tauschii subsp. strangulata TaxID=200361 RepID=UPI003CC86F50